MYTIFAAKNSLSAGKPQDKPYYMIKAENNYSTICTVQ